MWTRIAQAGSCRWHGTRTVTPWTKCLSASRSTPADCSGCASQTSTSRPRLRKSSTSTPSRSRPSQSPKSGTSRTGSRCRSRYRPTLFKVMNSVWRPRRVACCPETWPHAPDQRRATSGSSTVPGSEPELRISPTLKGVPTTRTSTPALPTTWPSDSTTSSPHGPTSQRVPPTGHRWATTTKAPTTAPTPSPTTRPMC